MQAQFTDLMHYLELEEPATESKITDCERLLQRVLDALQDPITASGALVTHDPLPTLVGMSRRLQLVLQELIENAVKFRGSGPPQIHGVESSWNKEPG
jgi:chemotaxis family two-component system sensor kinase Cph1